MNNEFKARHSGKKLSEIAAEHVSELMQAGEKDEVIQKAALFARGAILAEQLLERNDVGEANVHFMGAIIAGIMSSIPPAVLRAHFDDMLNDAITLRRIHDPQFDDFLNSTINFIVDDGKGQVH